MKTNKSNTWRVKEHRPGDVDSDGHRYYHVEGPEMVQDYEDWGFTWPEAVRISKLPAMLKIIQDLAKPGYDQRNIEDRARELLRRMEASIESNGGKK